ncbi:hypothetical protein R6Z07M_017079 [Ovis aries]
MSTCDKRVGGARRQDPGAGAGAWALPGQPAPTCRFQGDQSEKRCQRADAPRGPAATHSPASLRLARGASVPRLDCCGSLPSRLSLIAQGQHPHRDPSSPVHVLVGPVCCLYGGPAPMEVMVPLGEERQ